MINMASLVDLARSVCSSVCLSVYMPSSPSIFKISI